MDEIVVIGGIPYRDRSDATEPQLEYDAEYFQRFEPLTAGDALRRVPSVTFLSDVLESDGARLRGLAPAYTQILINGERVPGSGPDRSFFLDRIPAELIERVEIVRSSSARRTGDAIAGALNIVLRDGYDVDGGYLRAGASRFDDGDYQPSYGAVWGGEVGPGRLLVGANSQGRYNPKQKRSLRFGDSPENNPAFATEEFDNREDQDDTRDGDDYSLNSRYTVRFSDDSEVQIGGFLNVNERTEAERSLEYDDPTAQTGPVPDGNLLTDAQQFEDIEQTNYTVDLRYRRPMLGGTTKLRAGFARFDEQITSDEVEVNFEDAEFEAARETIDLVDDELTLQAAQSWPVGADTTFEVGLYWQDKQRDNEILEGDDGDDFTGDWNQFEDQPFQLRSGAPELEPVTGGVGTIDETRLDAYGVLGGKRGALSWELGLRYETTDTDIFDATVEMPGAQRASHDYDILLPSAHLRYELTDHDRVSASVARTVRRPEFDLISPVLLEEEVADNDLLGNPELEPEIAWGLDLGYERRLGRAGVVGINGFYRAVDDLIELANTGVEGSEGPGTFILQAQNTGDGDVYGVEFDLSTPLDFVGLPDTGFFANYSWLDSEVDDVFGSRRFNDQSDYVFNVGFIHSLPAWDAAFGATYRKQGDAFGRIVGEEVTTTYGEDLEVFVEKSFFKRLTLRLVGANLLDAEKDEVFNKFDNIDDQVSRDFDEYELESEQAGPVFRLIARLRF